MTDSQKQQYASIVRQVGAGLASLYGILTLSGVTAREPTWFTAVLVALGPAVQLLEHSTLSPGGPPPPAPVAGPPGPLTPQITHTVTEGTPIAPLPPAAQTSSVSNIAAGSPPSPIRPV